MGQRDDPQLLEVVPWNYGFAHTWALKWLLGDADLATRILHTIPELRSERRLQVDNRVVEHKVRGALPDLRFDLTTSGDRVRHVAAEIKVNA